MSTIRNDCCSKRRYTNNRLPILRKAPNSGSDKGHFAVPPRSNRTNCAGRVHIFVIVPEWLCIRFPSGHPKFSSFTVAAIRSPIR